jgi:hypothetical protein
MRYVVGGARSPESTPSSFSHPASSRKVINPIKEGFPPSIPVHVLWIFLFLWHSSTRDFATLTMIRKDYQYDTATIAPWPAIARGHLAKEASEIVEELALQLTVVIRNDGEV